MRPRIEGDLEELAAQAAEEAGYRDPAELVRDAVRRRAEEILNNDT